MFGNGSLISVTHSTDSRLMVRLILTLEIKAFYPQFQLILSFTNTQGECGEFSTFDVYALMIKRVLSVMITCDLQCYCYCFYWLSSVCTRVCVCDENLGAPLRCAAAWRRTARPCVRCCCSGYSELSSTPIGGLIGCKGAAAGHRDQQKDKSTLISSQAPPPAPSNMRHQFGKIL